MIEPLGIDTRSAHERGLADKAGDRMSPLHAHRVWSFRHGADPAARCAGNNPSLEDAPALYAAFVRRES